MLWTSYSFSFNDFRMVRKEFNRLLSISICYYLYIYIYISKILIYNIGYY